MPSHYPISLDVRGRRCLVVGAGNVAERKVIALVECGADVLVIAREATEELQAMADRSEIELRIGEPQRSDLSGCLLAIAATDDTELNTSMREWARESGVIINVVDVPALCDFIVPARIDRGPIAITISTGGAAPALAKSLRQTVEQHVTEAHGALAKLMGDLRPEVLSCIQDPKARADGWRRVVESDIRALLADGQRSQARAKARKLLGLEPEG